MSDSFLSVYDEHADAIFRYCLVRLGDRDLALDITQETFIRAWDYSQKDPLIKSMKALLFRIAQNLMIDHFRKKKAISLDLLVEAHMEPVLDKTQFWNERIDQRELLRALNCLQPRSKDIVVLRYVEGFSIEEVAELMDLQYNHVSVLINRALKELRNFLKYEDF